MKRYLTTLGVVLLLTGCTASPPVVATVRASPQPAATESATTQSITTATFKVTSTEPVSITWNIGPDYGTELLKSGKWVKQVTLTRELLAPAANIEIWQKDLKATPGKISCEIRFDDVSKVKNAMKGTMLACAVPPTGG